MKSRAFSLVEVLVTLAAAGVLGSIAYVSIGNVPTRASQQKLASDVETLNRAVGGYLAMGGSLEGAQSPAEVIARLKTTTSADEGRRVTGFSGAFIDPRLGVELVPDGRGVAWNADRQRFVLDGTGPGAVATFTLDDSLAELAPVEETRERVVSYAKESAWIWDYQDRPVTWTPGATEMVVIDESDTGATGMPTGTEVPEATSSLVPPQFSIPAGRYDIRDFDLSVALTNRNPGGSSKLVYAIDYGNWRDYSGPITVAPGSVLSAQAVSIHSRWGDSAKLDQEYEADPVALAAPAIEPSHPSFGMFYRREVEVALSNPNPSEHSRLEYRVAGGAWQTYAAPFVLSRNDFADGAGIEARAVTVESPYYLDSPVATRVIPVDPFEASGETSGQFANASGTARMVTSLDQGGPGETFAWGETLPVNNPHHTDQSRLGFAGAEFAEVAPGRSFQIGSLSYYNGTILGGTGADRIDLTIHLDLSVNGIAFRPDFTFSFDLLNTANTDDAWASADFVRIADPVARQSLVVNDYEYQFEIEFGRTTSAGYALFDEFHVLEDATAAAEIYGTLVEIGRVAL